MLRSNTVDENIRKMFVRFFSIFKSDNFKNDLGEKITNFLSSIYFLLVNNINQIFDEFYSILTYTINISAPLKKFSRKQTCL